MRLKRCVDPKPLGLERLPNHQGQLFPPCLMAFVNQPPLTYPPQFNKGLIRRPKIKWNQWVFISPWYTQAGYFSGGNTWSGIVSLHFRGRFPFTFGKASRHSPVGPRAEHDFARQPRSLMVRVSGSNMVTWYILRYNIYTYTVNLYIYIYMLSGPPGPTFWYKSSWD